MRRLAESAVVAGCVLLIPSCSTPEVVGTPAATILTKEDLFEPCKIPDAWYFVTIQSTTHTFAEVKTNPHSYNFRTATVEGRNAIAYWSINDPNGDICDVAFPTSHGVAIVRVATFARHPIERDPCLVGAETASSLNTVIPQ